MFKKFARWILANEINESEIKLDIAKAQIVAEGARVDDLLGDYYKAEALIAKVFYATQGIKNGTGKKVYRMIQDYYDAS